MPDITMCKGTKCPMKDTCYRAMAVPSEYRQSYWVKPPIDKATGKCDSYSQVQEGDRIMQKEFKQQVLGEWKSPGWDPHTNYYVGFLYDGVGPELHCTHKYFGKLTELQYSMVVDYLDGFFAEGYDHKIHFTFNKEDFMGHGYKTRVLRPEISLQSARNVLLPELRRALDSIRKDTYGAYIPHVTCPRDVVELTAPLTRYALIGSGGVIIKEWKL